MYDKEAGISGEDPRHIEFIKNVAIPKLEEWGYEVKILRSERDYLDVFHRVIERPRKHMHHAGMKYGFAISGLCSVKRDCKMKPINDYYTSLNDNYVEYVGIAIDEPKRLESMHKSSKKISLLEKHGYTEQMAKNLCREFGLLSPIYETSSRGGCWMCPNAKVGEHRDIKRIYPKVWESFVKLETLDNIAQPKWNVYGKTLKQRDEEINKPEATQVSIWNLGADL